MIPPSISERLIGDAFFLALPGTGSPAQVKVLSDRDRDRGTDRVRG